MIGGHKIVALYTTRVRDEDSFKLIMRLNQRLVEEGHRLLVLCANSELIPGGYGNEAQETIFQLFPYETIDVVVIMEEKINDKKIVDEILQRAKQAGKPILTIGKEYKGCGNVQFAYEQGFEAMVRHVIAEHGVMDLHLIAGIKNNRFSDNRIAVFKQIYEEYGGSFREDMVSFGEFWSEPAREAAEKLVREDRVPKGIICCNDVMAIAVCEVLKKYGYEIPGDVLVTGFDGIDDACFSDPPITSCQCRFEDIAEQLADCVDLPAEEFPRIRRKVAPYLIRSQSCGCVVGEKADTSDRLAQANNRFYVYEDSESVLTRVGINMQQCNRIEEAADCLKGYPQLADITCMLRREVLDETQNPMEKPSEPPEELTAFFDADVQEGFLPFEMPAEEILPGMEEILRRPYPMFFAPISYCGIELGYVCYHFQSRERNNLLRIAQIAGQLGNALGNLWSRKHIQYLSRNKTETEKKA